MVLCGALQQFKQDTKTALSNLATLAPSAKYDIKELARLKNSSLDRLQGEVEALRALLLLESSTDGGGNGSVAVASRKQNMQILPEPLECGDILDESILPFLCKLFACWCQDQYEYATATLQLYLTLNQHYTFPVAMQDVSRGVAYTCKRWYKASRSEKIWKRMLKRDLTDVVAPLCHEGILTSTPATDGQMTFLEFVESRFKADAIIRSWLSPETMEHPATRKLLNGKPEQIHNIAWLYKLDKVECGANELSYLCRGVIIPEFFERYSTVALAEYERRDDEVGREDYGDDPVILPDLPLGLSPNAIQYHQRA